MYDPTCVPHFDFIELSEDAIRNLGLEVTDTMIIKYSHADTNLINITVITT